MDLQIQSPLPRRRDFRIGIVGSGFIVNDCHLVAYRKAGFNPVAIASRNREHAQRVASRHDIPKVCRDGGELLDDPAIEVLDIAVPPQHQLELIKAACARRTVKGILAQKPLGVNYGEAVEAVHACEEAGITLAVNQNMRYDPSVRAGKSLLDRGVLGEPVLATIEMRGIPHWMSWQAELGWLTLRIMSIHHLDCFRYWFGDPEGVYCSVRPDPRTPFPHTDGICTYVLEYGNRLRCVGLDDPWTGPAMEGCPADHYIRWRIEGTNGLAIGDIGWCKDPCTTPSTLRYAARGDAQFHEPRWSESWFPDAFIGTMAQLLIALETGTEPVISGRDNLKTMALVEAAYLSAAQFRSVGLDEIDRQQHREEWRQAEREVFREPLPAMAPGWYRRLFAKLEANQADDQNWRESTDVRSLSPRALQVLALARREADQRNHNFIGTEHLLLGLICLGQGVAVSVLGKLGVNLDAVRAEIEALIGPGSEQKVPGNIPYTPRVKKVLALAGKEALALGHKFVGTEHLLLGLIREGDGVAALALKRLDVDLEATRHEILRQLDPNRE